MNLNNVKGGESASSECPRCYSKKVWKDGIRKTKKGKVQRYICNECDYRFSESTDLFRTSDKIRKHQVCDSVEGSKNLIVAKKENRATGEISEIKSQLFQYAWYLKKQGYAESTTETRVRILKILAKRGANLLDHESVKKAIYNQKWCNKRKANAVDAYNTFLKMRNETWNPPRYKVVRKLPFVPKESELDDLIAGCGSKTSVFLHLLKETAVRCGEAHKIEWKHVDFERKLISVIPEKGSNPKIAKISTQLLNKLVKIRSNNRVKNPDRIFAKNLRTVRRVYSKQRNRLAEKLENPRLKRITFHTFRHWFGTMYYHRTKDLLRTQQKLGHRSILNTMMYIQLEEAYFQDLPDDFICKTASNVKEASELIELGYDYVCEVDELKLFKKPKPVG